MRTDRKRVKKGTNLRVRNCTIVDGLDVDDIFKPEFIEFEDCGGSGLADKPAEGPNE